MVYNRTVTRFIADDKVVYQRVRREIQLASDNSWASFEACELEITVNCIPVYTWIENDSFMRNLTSGSVQFLACPLDWAQGPPLSPLLCDKRSLPLPGCIVTFLIIAPYKYSYLLTYNCTWLVASLQQTVDASKFPTLVRQFNQNCSCTTLLWQMDIFNQSHIFLWNIRNFV